jgi:electron transport complex protein RnfD/electron transport complex protein RnfC
MNTNTIMLLVALSLLPTTGFGIYHFGLRALWVILVTIGSAVLTEAVFGLFTKKNTLHDLSAVVTGLILALNLPSVLPLWMAAMGGVFAILIVKLFFGGLGQNFLNPALASKCLLTCTFPVQMLVYNTSYVQQRNPLFVLREGGEVDVLDMILGYVPGGIGETSAVALLIGVCILLLTGIIDLKIPVTYIGSFVLVMGILGGSGFDPAYLVAEVAGGSLIFGAFYMANDYTTRPITVRGKYLYGIFLGAVTALLRIYTLDVDGVCLAILLGNIIVPLIEKLTRPVPFGYRFGEESNE